VIFVVDSIHGSGIGKGRRKIFDDRKINKDTIIQILFDAMNIHRLNVADMRYLVDYYKGQQDILERTAPSTTTINNKVVLNYAHSSIRDIVGYTFGKPVQIIPRKAKYRKDIKKLSDIFEYENSSTVDNEVATYAAICGLSYICTLPSEDLTSDYMPDVPIKISKLDVFNTFVVQSRKMGNPVRLSCTYWSDRKNTYFSVFTDTQIFYIKSEGNMTLSGTKNEIQEDVNLIGLNPIQMVQNNEFLMGDFEVAISVLNALNQIASDSVNDVENVIKSLLVIINSELDDNTTETAKKNRILELIGAPGQNVDAKFLYQQLDSMGISDLREYLEEAYKTIIGIPDRKTRGGGGGDTGDAVKLRDGWADIEIVARIKESYFKIAKKKQIAVAIKILQLLGLANIDFKTIDLDVKFTRNKNDNLQTKAQSFSTLHGTKVFDPADALEMCDLTTDVTEVVDRGKKYWDNITQENLKLQQETIQTTGTDKSDENEGKQSTTYNNNMNKISEKHNEKEEK
jgi:SPP1 family phage portal protein